MGDQAYGRTRTGQRQVTTTALVIVAVRPRKRVSGVRVRAMKRTRVEGTVHSAHDMCVVRRTGVHNSRARTSRDIELKKRIMKM